jgi:two-component system nitrate/nitrite sensor histidine kinase NarX
MAAEMSRLTDLDDILHLTLRTCLDTSGMDAGGVLLLDQSAGNLHLGAHIGASPALLHVAGRVGADEGIIPRMLARPQAVVDLSAVTAERRVVLEKEGFASLTSVPLVCGDNLLGVIVLASRHGQALSLDETRLLTLLGQHVGSVVFRTNLQAQALRTAILEEQQAMAREMHDDIAQTLGYLGLQVDQIKRDPSLVLSERVQAELETVRKAIESAYTRVRASISRLRKQIPEHYDLESVLDETIGEFRQHTQCTLNLEINVDWLAPLAPLVAIQASHIIREALTNIRKHAKASNVRLALARVSDDVVEITICDDGRGFDVDLAPQSDKGGLGLRFMAERAERVGGSLRLESEPGQGTRVEVRLPAS